jgi:hypothetical protein
MQVSLGHVYGEPIAVKKQNPVDPEYLDLVSLSLCPTSLHADTTWLHKFAQIHSKIQVSVKSIFDRHKGHFGYAADETLTFVTVKEARTITKDAKFVKKD